MDHSTFTAYYGTFNDNMIAYDVTDVTHTVKKKFLTGDHLKIPAKTNFKRCFGGSSLSKRKFLQIKIGTRLHNIAEDKYRNDINIDLYDTAKRIKLIYYVYINRNADWKAIVGGQLTQLKSYGLFDESDLYIHLTDTAGKFDDVIELIKGICELAIISTSAENHFEYPAIRLIYDLAIQYPEATFMYLHSKGMSYQVNSRSIEEVVLLGATFENWRYNLQFLEADHLNKMGLFPALSDNKFPERRVPHGGWIWFNFWYAKGRYLANCDEPEINENRHVFEHWLGLQKGPLVFIDDCHNLYSGKKNGFFKKKKKYFTSAEGAEGVLHLIRTKSMSSKS